MGSSPHSDRIHSLAPSVRLAKDGVGSVEQYDRLRRIAHTLCERDGVNAIVLAGTDFSLLFNPSNTDFPHIDGARVHIAAIMRRLFEEPA
jgi:aspartate racemase